MWILVKFKEDYSNMYLRSRKNNSDSMLDSEVPCHSVMLYIKIKNGVYCNMFLNVLPTIHADCEIQARSDLYIHCF